MGCGSRSVAPRTVFEPESVEYPTTRQMESSLQDRARDIMAAFSDPRIKATLASIGGNNQIKLIKYLDPQVFIDNPKQFFGFSGNTHLHNSIKHALFDEFELL